jgi:hypothetical protein
MPWMSSPLISIARLRESGVIFSNLESKWATLKDTKGPLRFKVPEKNGLYPLTTWKPASAKSSGTSKTPLTMQEAHLRLNHIPFSTICHLVKHEMVSGLRNNLNTPEKECKTCIEAK